MSLARPLVRVELEERGRAIGWVLVGMGAGALVVLFWERGRAIFKVMVGMVVGALIALIATGYLTRLPNLPGKELVRKLWSVPAPQKTRASSSHWRSEPKVNNGQVEVTAWGAAPMEGSKNRSDAVSLALRTARHLAYEQLAEFLQGARTYGQSQQQAEVLQRAALRPTTTPVIRGARIAREEVRELPDGSIQAAVTIRHPVPRKAGL